MRPNNVANERIAQAISSVRLVRRRMAAYHAMQDVPELALEANLIGWEKQLARVCSVLGDDRPLRSDDGTNSV